MSNAPAAAQRVAGNFAVGSGGVLLTITSITFEQYAHFISIITMTAGAIMAIGSALNVVIGWANKVNAWHRRRAAAVAASAAVARRFGHPDESSNDAEI